MPSLLFAADISATTPPSLRDTSPYTGEARKFVGNGVLDIPPM